MEADQILPLWGRWQREALTEGARSPARSECNGSRCNQHLALDVLRDAGEPAAESCRVFGRAPTVSGCAAATSPKGGGSGTTVYQASGGAFSHAPAGA
jgi:hypothetical protein